MKKLISLFAIGFFLVGGVAMADYDESGAVRNSKLQHPGLNSDAVKVITLVRYGDANPNTPSISSGDVVIWDLTSKDGVSINLNSVVGAAGAVLTNDAVAGIAVGTIPTSEPGAGGSTLASDNGRRNWGYIQIYGVNTTAKVDGSTILAGSGLRASADPRRAGIGSAATGSIGGGPLGFAFAATSASSDAATIFVRVE